MPSSSPHTYTLNTKTRTTLGGLKQRIPVNICHMKTILFVSSILKCDKLRLTFLGCYLHNRPQCSPSLNIGHAFTRGNLSQYIQMACCYQQVAGKYKQVKIHKCKETDLCNTNIISFDCSCLCQAFLSFNLPGIASMVSFADDAVKVMSTVFVELGASNSGYFFFFQSLRVALKKPGVCNTSLTESIEMGDHSYLCCVG